MVEAYMHWRSNLGDRSLADASPGPPAPNAEGTKSIVVLDLFCESRMPTFETRTNQSAASYSYEYDMLPSDLNVPAALLRRGLIPSSAFTPHTCVTIRALEVFRTTHLRCPALSLEPFVKALCDLHCRPFNKNINETFSLCYDTFTNIQEKAEEQVLQYLDRDANNWRRRNACVACTYRLLDEKKLDYDMLVTMDGNDSLKRVIRRDHSVSTGRDGGETLEGVSIEREDSRTVKGDYYLTRTEANKWSDENIQAMRGPDALAEEEEDPEEVNPCETRWQNMSDRTTARSWGIFDETGIFLTLCRHGHVLVIMDMVRSGEQ
jgi:Kyakuja-Dileera-Zisupton transposase